MARHFSIVFEFEFQIAWNSGNDFIMGLENGQMLPFTKSLVLSIVVRNKECFFNKFLKAVRQLQ
jgi:hypothetical protein